MAGLQGRFELLEEEIWVNTNRLWCVLLDVLKDPRVMVDEDRKHPEDIRGKIPVFLLPLTRIVIFSLLNQIKTYFFLFELLSLFRLLYGLAELFGLLWSYLSSLNRMDLRHFIEGNASRRDIRLIDSYLSGDRLLIVPLKVIHERVVVEERKILMLRSGIHIII